MTWTSEPGEERPTDMVIDTDPVVGGGSDAGGAAAAAALWEEGTADLAAETAELIAQIRQLAAHDPDGVQRVVTDVLTALGRATDGAVAPLAESLGDGRGEFPVPVTE